MSMFMFKTEPMFMDMEPGMGTLAMDTNMDMEHRTKNKKHGTWKRKHGTWT